MVNYNTNPFSFDGATLTISGNGAPIELTTAVPVPAASWLFISAGFGLFSLKKTVGAAGLRTGTQTLRTTKTVEYQCAYLAEKMRLCCAAQFIPTNVT